MVRTLSLGLGAILLLALSLPGSAEPPPQIGKISRLDQEFMQQQRQRIDSLARSGLGRQLQGERNEDLSTLQYLLDRKLVRAGQQLELQAMGIIMGDLLAAELGMKWVIYEDRYGRSRALRLDDSDNFLFPVTMISRRVEADATVSVTAVYDKARAMIEPYKTPLPFQ